MEGREETMIDILTNQMILISLLVFRLVIRPHQNSNRKLNINPIDWFSLEQKHKKNRTVRFFLYLCRARYQNKTTQCILPYVSAHVFHVYDAAFFSCAKACAYVLVKTSLTLQGD